METEVSKAYRGDVSFDSVLLATRMFKMKPGMKWYSHPFRCSMCRQTLGTSACPPYHVALVIGGTSVCSSNVPQMFGISEDIMVPDMFQMI